MLSRGIYQSAKSDLICQIWAWANWIKKVGIIQFACNKIPVNVSIYRYFYTDYSAHSVSVSTIAIICFWRPPNITLSAIGFFDG